MIDVPRFHEFMRALLDILQKQGELARNDAIEAVIQRMGITEEQMAITQESNGMPIVRGRIGWASSYLRVAGALTAHKLG